MIANLQSLLAIAAIALASYGLGGAALLAARLSIDDPWSRWTWRTAIGLTLAGTLLAFLGLAGRLSVASIATLTSVGALAALGVGWRERRAPRPPSHRRATTASRAKDARRDAPHSLATTTLVMSGVGLVATLLVALAPPTAGDALCYHLELPKTFLRSGELSYSPDVHEATFPLLAEMWFLWGLVLDGPVAAQLAHYLVGLLFLLAVREAAAPLGPRWAWVAAAVAALAPIATNEMTAPLNDVAVAAFATLAWAAGERADREAERRAAWWLVAGVALGGACAIKFTGLVFAVAWLAARWVKTALAMSENALADERRARRAKASPARECSAARGPRALLIVTLTTLAISGVWYGRAAWHTGNPVHPYFSTFFGNPAETSMRESKRPLGRNPVRWLAAPFETTFSPERFGGRAHQFGPLFLATLPALAFLARDPRAWPAITLVAVYAFFWLMLRQNLRFALPLLPFFSLGVVVVWRALPASGRGRLAALAVALAMLSFETLVAVRRVRQAWPVALGAESRDEYLTRCEPTAEAARLVARVTPDDARLLSQETRAFYFERDVVRESLYRRRTGAYDASSAPSVVGERLARDGFTHLLLAERVTPDAAPYDDVLSRIVARDSSPTNGKQAPSSPAFRSLGEAEGRDLDGAKYRYRLVAITAAESPRR